MSNNSVPARVDSLSDWQLEEIRAGLAEADRGEFATDQEVQQVLTRWIHRKGSPEL